LGLVCLGLLYGFVGGGKGDKVDGRVKRRERYLKARKGL